jgi:hypothetical protein
MTFQPTEMYNDIAELQIADGLKELLIEYGFTRKKIVRVQANPTGSNSRYRRLYWENYLQCCEVNLEKYDHSWNLHI